MLRSIPVLSMVLFAGCATAAQTSFATAGTGSVSLVVECAAEEVREHGFTVTHADEAGILHAERGAERVEVRIVPGDLNRFVIEVETSDTELARAAATDVVQACGG